MPTTYHIVTQPLEMTLTVDDATDSNEGQHPPGLPIAEILQAVMNREKPAEGKTVSPPPVPSGQESTAPTAQQVLVPSDSLYQAYSLLFPAERMLVIAGMRADAERLRLGAVFDVTNTSTTQLHQAHVQADSHKLGQALRMMDYSGTALGAWVHSHPGTGSRATFPSQIDSSQHHRWLRHYPATLISIIMVEDGFFRVFGSAIENGRVQLQFDGKGIVQEENHVYRLTKER